MNYKPSTLAPRPNPLRSLVAIAFVACFAQQAAAIPTDDILKSLRPSSDVNDFAGLLTPDERESLEARCKLLRERTGAQLAVVTLKSLEGGDIDDFAVKLFKQWGIGQKDKKNGLLLIAAVEDRKARIEVGYGLEPIIPDALAGRILVSDLYPQFRNQKYAAGLTAAVNSLCELVEKNEPADRTALIPNQKSVDIFSTVLFLAIFVAFGGFALGTGLGLPQAGMAMFGLFFAGIGMLSGFGVGGALALILHLIIAAVCAAFGWTLAKQGGNGPGGGRRRVSTGPGWNWSSFPTSSGGGWSSGGGGFSQDWGGFGGGSSGGGGASGSW